MKKLKILLIGISLLMAFASNQVMACGKVTITEMNWNSGVIVTSVAKFFMEKGYGCEVQKIPSATITALTSLAENNEPDIATEIWTGSAPLYHELIKAGKIHKLADVLQQGGNDGWWVPKYLVDKYPEMAKIDGVLKHGKLIKLFNNCPDGWACRVSGDNLSKALQLEKHGIKVFNHGSGETLATSIAAAYANKEPWFGYYWGPTAILGKYEMVKVDLGGVDPKKWECIQRKDCKNPQVASYPVSEVVTAVTDTFKKREPKVTAFLSKMEFPNMVMNKLLAWKEDNKASGEEAAVHFITTYQDTWKNWVDGEAKEKLSNLL